ncbi:MAG: GAF domain-containing sensor histidine kinase [Candidatus Margulisbacteria bacterium]|nr:GAF domain-containing sensor histidine kinase [Candidatus Margulisiibacteriota bacterium]
MGFVPAPQVLPIALLLFAACYLAVYLFYSRRARSRTRPLSDGMVDEVKRSREIMENWNKELETKVEERTEDLQVLFDISKAIGSSLDLELLIDHAIGHLLPVLHAKRYALLMVGEKGELIKQINRGYETLDPLAENKEQIEHALKDGNVILAGDNIVTPLRAKGQTLAVLLIGNIQRHKNSEGREVKLMATIADQLAVAIENAKIYEKEKEAVAKLTELDRLKNEFISMVSHELRTPVTSADGYVSLFLAGVTGAVTDDQKKYLTIIKENNQRLLTLINRLLDFSQIETGRFAIKHDLVSINDVINTSLGEMKRAVEKKPAKISLKLDATNTSFMGDAEKMKEVFNNLIENALKFAKSETPVEIEIMTKDFGDYLGVTVVDNGIGIGKEHLEKIFNKYYQVEETLTRKAGGVGLGLALVKEIIGNHLGRVWAESEGAGQGTRFIFTLPVAQKN